MSVRWTLLLVVLALLGAAGPAAAQTETDPTPPAPETDSETLPPVPKVHVVQAGETLVYIATLYETTVDAIQILNNIANPELLFEGQELLIPGVSGDLVATRYTVRVGDTLAGVAAAFNTEIAALAAGNRLLQPDLQAGQQLAVISRTGSAAPQPVTGIPHIVAVGETLLAIAARYGVSPADLAAANGLTYPALLFPGQRLRVPGADPYQFLPGEWTAIRVSSELIRPGTTISIFVDNLNEGTPQGFLGAMPLRFAPLDDGFVALAAFDPQAEAGSVQLELSGSGNRPWTPFRQTLALQPGGYGTQAINVGAGFEDLLDPTVRAEEDAFFEEVFSTFTPEPLWAGLFQAPISGTVFVTADYGALRSYNGGPYEIYHTGVDYGVAEGTPVSAPAAGEVVFAGFLRLRGNVIIIDHGLGVMTAYFHLARIDVAVGASVEQGQLIGAVGNTGLSSGPHLHWDLRINNVPVNGTQWLVETFP